MTVETAHPVSWIFANLGLGYDFAYTFDEGWAHGFHFFAGGPFPLGGDPPEEHGGVIEPYLRLGGLWGERSRFQMEFGVLIKFSAVLDD